MMTGALTNHLFNVYSLKSLWWQMHASVTPQCLCFHLSQLSWFVMAWVNLGSTLEVVY